MGGTTRIIYTLKPQSVALCTLLRASINVEEVAGDESVVDHLLNHIQGQNVSRDVPLSRLLSILKSDLGGSETGTWAAAVIVDQLKGIRTPDDLVILFSEMAELLHDAPSPEENTHGFDPHSAIGHYLRCCLAAFNELTFEGVCRLFNDVAGYVREDSPASSQPQPGEAPTAGRVCVVDEHGEAINASGLSRDLFRVHLLALKRQDVTQALSTLHQHFDYAGRESGEGALSGTPQSALLSLGAAHTHFGHIQEASLALNEALRKAQQSNDHTALAHALAVLTRLFDVAAPAAAPAVQELRAPFSSHTQQVQLLRLLRNCHSRAKALCLPHIAAYARLALAKFKIEHNPEAGSAEQQQLAAVMMDAQQTCPMGEAAAAMAEVADLNISSRLQAAIPLPPLPPAGPPSGGTAAANVPRPAVADLFTGGTRVFDPAAHESQASAASAVEDTVAVAHLLKAAAYNRCGAPGEALTASLAYLASPSGSVEDQQLAYAQLALHAAEHRSYSAAARVLDLADEEFPDGQSRQLRMARLRIGHSRALARQDVIMARHLGALMAAVSDPSDVVHLNLRVEAETQNVQSLVRAGSLEEAASAASSLFDICQESGLQAEGVRLLLILADIHSRASQPCAALPYALSAWLHAKELQMDVMAAEASAAVAAASAKLGPGASVEACAALRQELPRVLGSAPKSVQAAVQMQLGEALLASSTAEQLEEDPDRVLGPLTDAACLYEGLEDWAAAAEAHHLIALVHDAAHQIPQRNIAAGMWQRLSVRAAAQAYA